MIEEELTYQEMAEHYMKLTEEKAAGKAKKIKASAHNPEILEDMLKAAKAATVIPPEAAEPIEENKTTTFKRNRRTPKAKKEKPVNDTLSRSDPDGVRGSW